jgi:hypothetical protein
MFVPSAIRTPQGCEYLKVARTCGVLDIYFAPTSQLPKVVGGFNPSEKY